MKDIERLVRKNIAALTPYSTARDDFKGEANIFLDANESPYPGLWNRYPDPHQQALKSRISDIKGVAPENIFLGNGSDEAIDLVLRIFCEPGRDEAIAISPSYGMYEVAAAVNDVRLVQVRLRPDFSLDNEAILAAVTPATKLIFLCSPNNPSGNAFPAEQVLRLAEDFDGILVVDEAYVDFSSVPSLINAAAEGKPGNIVVLQTMSKARGMAGLRLGMAFSTARIISLMSMVKYPYNISKATQQEAMLMLETPIEGQVAEIVSERSRLAEALPAVPCVVKVWPSDANFLLVEVSDPRGAYEYLLARGIIVRRRDSLPLCSGCLRITVGTPEENDSLLEALAAFS